MFCICFCLKNLYHIVMKFNAANIYRTYSRLRFKHIKALQTLSVESENTKKNNKEG